MPHRRRGGGRGAGPRGGGGGGGNAVFRSANHQTPRIAENGEPGVERWLYLELKLIADIGIIGVPNAGKSTLLAAVTQARPKIADYPFTTLTPNLGVAIVDDRDLVLADIPGLIEGAHAGVGLGITFLRHIERTRLLIHVLNGLSPDPIGDYEVLNQELEWFNPYLVDRPQIVVFNKMDLPDVQERWPSVRAGLQRLGVEALAISAATGENVLRLLRQTAATLASLPPAELLVPARPVALPIDEDVFSIEHEATGWFVHGKRIERVANMTNWDYYEAGLRFQRVLEAMGITEALRKAGVKEGDTVFIGNAELAWSDDYHYDR